MVSTSIADRLHAVRQQIAAACVAVGRDPAEVTLIAVSKHHEAAAIRAAWAAGQRAFGESYPAEFRDKRSALCDLPIDWHFVGHAQRNKIKWVAGAAGLVHSVHDQAGIEAFAKRAQSQNLVQDVLLQVNIGEEASKRGCRPEDAPTLAAQIASLKIP